MKMTGRNVINWLNAILPAILLAGGLAGISGFAAAPAQAAGPGPEVCKNCHASQVESYEASTHGQKGNLKGPANAGACAACHGDGTAHVAAGGGKGVGGIINPSPKSKMPADAKSKICLACHETERELAFWDSGKHKKNDVSCTNCHNPHSGSPSSLRKDHASISPYSTSGKQPQYETCATCHKDIRAQIGKPSHHPILEGKVKCSDCHNPHGALSKSMIKSESINTLCISCHTEKRGPYIHEHPPVEENCLTCHDVHGSQHTKLLNEKVPNLCQNCHSSGRHPGTIYGSNMGFGGTAQNSRFFARSCVNCHNQIHGSNASTSGRGEFFTR